jgi:hypothetical protein
MSKIKIESYDHTIQISIPDASASLDSVEINGRAAYQLKFNVGYGSGVTVNLTHTELQSLALQCISRVPSVVPSFTSAVTEDVFRAPARVIKGLSDYSIQKIARELSYETLCNFLWYMKDVELLKKIIQSASLNASARLLEELNYYWRGINPDNALERVAQKGRDATAEVMKIACRLSMEGFINDLMENNNDK